MKPSDVTLGRYRSFWLGGVPAWNREPRRDVKGTDNQMRVTKSWQWLIGEE